MAMSRGQTWLALVVVGIGGLIAAVLGLFAYMTATARPLHQDPQSVQSTADSVPSQKWAAAVERGQQIMRTGLAEQNLPGASVAVGIDGEIVWAEGFGWANLEGRTPVAPNTRFRIGNVSSSLTSAAVGLLLEQQKLNLDDEIQKYVPAFPKKQWPITVRQLMGHLAGIRNDEGDEEPIGQHCEETAEGLQRFANGSLLFEPGTQYRRSSYSWILVSAAVESAASEPFFQFMQTQIFDPLGMTSTIPDSSTEPIQRRATFYFPRFAADTRYGPELARDGDYSCFAGAAAFLSTPSDLVRFGTAVGRGKLLQPATAELLQTPQKLTSGQSTDYGLGWTLGTIPLAGEPARKAGHDTRPDFIGGTASLETFPQRGIVVAITTNTSFANTSALAVSVAQAFAEQRKNPARQ
jgi:serine beta-lactamase-like protein LACTB